VGNGIVQRDAAGIVAGVEVSAAGNQEIGNIDTAPESSPVQGSFAAVIPALQEPGIAFEERFNADKIAVPRGFVNGSTKGGQGRQQSCKQDQAG
jgi:hypothetical protein